MRVDDIPCPSKITCGFSWFTVNITAHAKLLLCQAIIASVGGADAVGELLIGWIGAVVVRLVGLVQFLKWYSC